MRLVLVGAVIGLAWAAGLRGWMIQMAAGEGSAFHWYGTFALVLLPGALVGAAFGLAEHRRRARLPRSRWLVLAPLLFSAALGRGPVLVPPRDVRPGGRDPAPQAGDQMCRHRQSPCGGGPLTVA